MRINIKPVQITGTCPAGITTEDVFHIEGMNIVHGNDCPICFLAVTHIPMMIWQIQSGGRFFNHTSCPGCTLDLEQENRVVYLLAHSDKWQLSQIISEYLRLIKVIREPDSAKSLKNEAIGHQERGEFDEAKQKMMIAVDLLKKSKE